MLNLENPTASAVRVSKIMVDMVGNEGPSINYKIDFGTGTQNSFAVAYSAEGTIKGADAIAFVQQFANIEPQFLQFLATLNIIPGVVVEAK